MYTRRMWFSILGRVERHCSGAIAAQSSIRWARESPWMLHKEQRLEGITHCAKRISTVGSAWVANHVYFSTSTFWGRSIACRVIQRTNMFKLELEFQMFESWLESSPNSTFNFDCNLSCMTLACLTNENNHDSRATRSDSNPLMFANNNSVSLVILHPTSETRLMHVMLNYLQLLTLLSIFHHYIYNENT